MLLLLRVPSTGDRVGAIDPPISQGLVAAAARAHGFHAEVLDLTWEGPHAVDALVMAVSDARIKMVGMAAYQSNIERCLRFAELIRRARPDVEIVLGGPQVTHMPPEGLAAMPAIDGLCRGAAERCVPDHLAGLLAGARRWDGFLYRDGDEVRAGGAAHVAS